MLAAVDSTVISSLLPVVFLIASGFVVGQRRWVGPGAIKDLSNLIFLLLAPALLFRTTSTVHVEQLSLSQRYRTAEALVTASVAVSTVLALGTLSLVMALVASL